MVDETKISWWLDHLENPRRVGDGYTARCPAHDDTRNSLSFKEIPGGILVNCFAGCSYSEILESINDGGPRISINRETQESPNLLSPTPDQSVRDWWEVYTQIPSHLWESWGVQYRLDSLLFTWPSSQTVKIRLKGTKSFSWSSSGDPTPGFWPEVPRSLEKDFWISEGESDCGVLRYLGLSAFSITKGISSLHNLLEALGESLLKRGVRRVLLVVDSDEAGNQAVKTLSKVSVPQALQICLVSLIDLLDLFQGEKDLRDLWRRYRDPETLRGDLESKIRPLIFSEARSWVSAYDLMTKPTLEIPWLVENTLLRDTVGMIVGSPKMGKSWLSLDLAVSVATGKPFLDFFPVVSPGAVVYISKEDPEYSLQDRLGKILQQKGFGGTIDYQDSRIVLNFPQGGESIPLILDLSRSFSFTEPKIDQLILDLREIEAQVGKIALVIFDPILRMLHDVDEYKVSDINEALFDPSSKIVKELETSVLLIHHRSKGQGSSKQSYGSVAFHAFSDSTLYLQGSEIPADGWVKVKNEFKSAPEFSWAYRFAELDQQYLPEARLRDERSIDSPIGMELVEAIRKKADTGALVTELEVLLPDLTIFQIRDQVKSLEAQGLLRREKETNRSGRGPRRDLWFVVEEKFPQDLDSEED